MLAGTKIVYYQYIYYTKAMSYSYNSNMYIITIATNIQDQDTTFLHIQNKSRI